MAMNIGGSRGAVISTINVTPMADVIIVLLIIFMVTLPVITRQVDLPDAARAQARADGPIVVTLRTNGSITLLSTEWSCRSSYRHASVSVSPSAMRSSN